MRSLMVACVVTLAFPALAQEPGGGAGDKPPAEAPAAAERTKVEPLDVSKMPFSPDSVRRVMTHHASEIQECYEEAMAEKNAAVEGKLRTSFIITREGLVKKARVLKAGTTLKHGGLHTCVVEVLQNLQFPKPADGRDHPIEYPFNLKALK